jgi:predicted DNA-binding protein
MSVRLPEEDLRKLQALAAVLGCSPNAILLEALRSHIPEVVASKEYVRAREDHLRRVQENNDLLESSLNGARAALSSASQR